MELQCPVDSRLPITTETSDSGHFQWANFYFQIFHFGWLKKTTGENFSSSEYSVFML